MLPGYHSIGGGGAGSWRMFLKLALLQVLRPHLLPCSLWPWCRLCPGACGERRLIFSLNIMLSEESPKDGIEPHLSTLIEQIFIYTHKALRGSATFDKFWGVCTVPMPQPLCIKPSAVIVNLHPEHLLSIFTLMSWHHWGQARQLSRKGNWVLLLPWDFLSLKTFRAQWMNGRKVCAWLNLGASEPKCKCLSGKMASLRPAQPLIFHFCNLVPENPSSVLLWFLPLAKNFPKQLPKYEGIDLTVNTSEFKSLLISKEIAKQS